MNNPKPYELYWNAIPMGALTKYKSWDYPCLGQGVYMFVLTTNQKNVYKVWYIGISLDIGKRWRDYIFNVFLKPNDEWYWPNSVGDFLENPVEVFNKEALSRGESNRNEIKEKILSKTWFCFAEIHCFNRWNGLEHVEYVLQEAVKQKLKIKVPGYIGDVRSRPKPKSNIAIHNHFYREFLRGILPQNILYKQKDETIGFVE